MSDFLRDVYAEEARAEVMKIKMFADNYLEAKLGDVRIPKTYSRVDDKSDGTRVYTY
jgi:hypothetical protein